jgi:hypothetical protein
MSPKGALLSGLTAAVLAGLFYGHDAKATFRQFNTAHCTASNLSSLSYGTTANTSSTGQLDNCGTSTVNFLCPVDNDTNFDPSTTATITVSGWNPGGSGLNGNLAATACRAYYGGNGGTCGTTYNTGSSSGVVHMTPSASVWTSATDQQDSRLLIVNNLGSFGGSCADIWSYIVSY